MAEILIRGMEMPKDGEVTGVMIYPDGKVRYSFDWLGIRIATAVPVPPHGRLIDADAMRAQMPPCYTMEEIVKAFKKAPTIIPAEEEKV